MDKYKEVNYWSPKPLKSFGIQRKQRRICFGIPGYIEEWIDCESYDTAEERDKALLHLEQFSDRNLFAIEYRVVDNNHTWMQIWQN